MQPKLEKLVHVSCTVAQVVKVIIRLKSLESVSWQPKFERPISCSTSGQGDQKVARVGRPETDYNIAFTLGGSRI